MKTIKHSPTLTEYTYDESDSDGVGESTDGEEATVKTTDIIGDVEGDDE